eukprot:Tbor_TRINITY_DN5333_c0_g3::TRINITY_DN5333_c0_g3_i1::g.4751::m.4751
MQCNSPTVGDECQPHLECLLENINHECEGSITENQHEFNVDHVDNDVSNNDDNKDTVDAITPSSSIYRLQSAIMEYTLHTERQLRALVTVSKEVAASQRNLRGSILPLMHECHGGHGMSHDAIMKLTSQNMDAVVDLLKQVECDAIEYEQEKLRHGMLMDCINKVVYNNVKDQR